MRFFAEARRAGVASDFLIDLFLRSHCVPVPVGPVSSIMSKSKISAIVLGVVAVLSLGLAFACSASTPMTMGADGSEPTAAIPWATLLSAIGFSSLGGAFATISAFWAKVQPIVGPIIHTVSPGVPVIPADISKPATDAIELVKASLAYEANKTDKNAQRRMILAAITEISDVTGMESPTVAAALNQLLIAAANVWAPAPPDTVKSA